MFQREILKLLKKVSAQLDEVVETQQGIRKQINMLHNEIVCFEEITLKDLEEKIAESLRPQLFLN